MTTLILPQVSAPPPTTATDPRAGRRRAYDRAEREAMYAGYQLYGYLDAARPWLVGQAAQAEQRGDLLAVAQFGGILRHLDVWRELERVREAAAAVEHAVTVGGVR
jgi:hypothetical protein